MAFRWQFPVRAHVPPARSTNDWTEGITIDKWEPEYPHLKGQPPRALPEAVRSSGCFTPPITEKIWGIFPDKWMGESPDIRFQKPGLSAAIVAGSFFFGREILTHGWYGESPDIAFRQEGLSRAIQVGLNQWTPWVEAAAPPETVTIDKWMGERPTYMFGRPGLTEAIRAGAYSGILAEGGVSESGMVPIVPKIPTHPTIHHGKH